MDFSDEFLVNNHIPVFSERLIYSSVIVIGGSLFPCFFTPPAYGHSPYLICDEQRERVKASLWTAFLFCEDFSYISLRRIGGEGWYLDMFSLLRIFFNPSVTMCHLPLYFAFQNAGEECRNLSITWFYCFYSPAVLPCSILCVATPVRLRDTAREECVNVLQCRVECRGG